MSADIQRDQLYPQDVENAWKTREDHLLGERKMQANPTANDNEEDLPHLLRMINGSCSLSHDYFDTDNNHHFIQENNTASNDMFTGFRTGSFTKDFFESEDHSANEIVNHAELVSQNSHRMEESFHKSSPEDTTVDISKLIVAEKQQNASSKHEISTAKCTTNVANPPPKSAQSRRSSQVEITRKISSRSRSSISSDPLEGPKDDTASNLMLPTARNSMHKTGKFKEKKFFSQPNPSITKLSDKMNGINRVYSGPVNGCKSKDNLNAVKKENYLLFETKSKKQFSQLVSQRLAQNESKLAGQDSFQTGKAMPAGRYFDALKGPELEILKVVRLNFFYGFKFSLTWWAYTFPMTALANATIHYSMEVQHSITQIMAVIFSFISSAVVSTLFVITVVQAIRGKLFPNDLAIAIAARRHDKRKQKGLKEGSSSCKSLAIDKSKLEKCDEVLAKESGVLIASNLHPKNTEIRVHT